MTATLAQVIVTRKARGRMCESARNAAQIPVGRISQAHRIADDEQLERQQNEPEYEAGVGEFDDAGGGTDHCCATSRRGVTKSR